MKLRNLNVNELQTDMSYQSPVKEVQVKRIVNNFDEASIDSIVVNRRDNGYYYIIDGQHRVQALKELGIGTVPAKVHEGLTVTEEAKLYKNINTRPTKSPNSMAKASLKQGDENAELILFSVLEAGLDIDYDNNNPTQNYITAYRSLERVYNKYGGRGLTETLVFIKDAFGIERTFFQGYIIEGFAKFLATYYEDLKKDNLLKRLQQKGFDNLMADVNKQRPNFNSKKECLPFVLTDIYNKNRKKDYKLDKKLLFI